MRGLAIAIVLVLGAAAPAVAGTDGPPVGRALGLDQLADSAACTYRCQSRYSACSAGCRTASCRSSCSARYSACLTGCTTRN
jgi:hypothetical protein